MYKQSAGNGARWCTSLVGAQARCSGGVSVQRDCFEVCKSRRARGLMSYDANERLGLDAALAGGRLARSAQQQSGRGRKARRSSWMAAGQASKQASSSWRRYCAVQVAMGKVVFVGEQVSEVLRK